MVTPCASASSRAGRTSRPALLVPSPETSMVRRSESNGARVELLHRKVDAAADRGAVGEGARRFQQPVAESCARLGTVDQRPVDDDLLRCRRPTTRRSRPRCGRLRPERIASSTRGSVMRGGIAFALQLEFGLVDAARHVGRQHQQQIDRLGRARREAAASSMRKANRTRSLAILRTWSRKPKTKRFRQRHARRDWDAAISATPRSNPSSVRRGSQPKRQR